MRVVDYELFTPGGKVQILRLETADGLVGWGEPLLEGRPRSTATAVSELLEGAVLDAEAGCIEARWQEMYRGGFYRGGPVLQSALAGIDRALWDLKGKRYGASVSDLLGGPVRDRIRLYRWIHGDTPAQIADAAREAVDAGFRSFKMNATATPMRRAEAPAAIEDVVERVGAAREAVGSAADLAVDFHGRIAKPLAPRVLDAIEPFDPFFVEEPVLPTNPDALPAIAAKTTIPVATGERMFGRWDFKPVLESGALDVAQPDLSHAGGITECRKIASMAAAYDAALAPHCPLGPIALAACLQVDAVSPNALVQEQTALDGGLPPWVANPDAFALEDGFVTVLDGPGLGIEVDGEELRNASGEADPWTAPTWHHDDGSLAEW